MHRRSLGLVLAALVLLLVPASAALAAPVTVNLRVEGPTSTVFEGPVTTDVRPFRFTTGADVADHTCNGTAVNQGTSPTPVPTRGAAIAAASLTAPFSTSGTFSVPLGSPSFSQIGGQSTAFDPATNRFLVEYKNGVTASVGSCGDPIANGDDVLFAYGTGTERLLRLSGPSTAAAGTPISVRVTDQATGAPVAGAGVGGATTDAAGNARLTFSATGLQRLKAEAPASIRSNALVVTVGAGQATTQSVAGATVDRTRPLARLISPRNGRRYRRSGFVPRAIRGSVTETGTGILSVKLRLTRRLGNRCWYYSGPRERFIGRGCRKGFFFRIGDSASFDYLLPEKLPRGRYVLDVLAVDKANNRDSNRRRGRNRVVFEVR